MKKEIPFEKLSESDLIIDAIYKGGSAGNAGDDPISKILNVGNQAGFRYKGSVNEMNLKYVVLYSSLGDPDWPDSLDYRTGIFTYYGDNKKAGHLLHETTRKGNLMLKNCFDLLARGEREKIPPFFIFTKAGNGRDVVFRGLAVPGAVGMESTNNLVAIWKTQRDERFQNYKATFTILDIPKISRDWIKDLEMCELKSKNIPKAYLKWIETGKYNTLFTETSREWRTKKEQLPTDKNDVEMLRVIFEHFNDSCEFEKCAAEIMRLMDENIISINLAQPLLNRGRCLLGKYRIGSGLTSIEVDFTMVSKLYDINHAVDFEECSRLISRIRHREFGAIITSSYVDEHAFKEISNDGQPIIIISGKDIIEILKRHGINNHNSLVNWLNNL